MTAGVNAGSTRAGTRFGASLSNTGISATVGLGTDIGGNSVNGGFVAGANYRNIGAGVARVQMS